MTSTELVAPALEWRPISGFEDLYEVSNAGTVRSLRTGKVLAPTRSGTRYHKAELHRGGKRTQVRLHRLVADAFLPFDVNRTEINHIDGNPLNNALSNLEWCTHSENVLHSQYVLGAQIKPIASTDIDTGAWHQYRSIEEAARLLGCRAPSIWNALNGRTKTCLNRTWVYLQEGAIS